VSCVPPRTKKSDNNAAYSASVYYIEWLWSCPPTVSVEPPWRSHGPVSSLLVFVMSNFLVFGFWFFFKLRKEKIVDCVSWFQIENKKEKLSFDDINVETSAKQSQEKHLLSALSWCCFTFHAVTLVGHEFHRRCGHRPLPSTFLPQTTTATSPGKKLTLPSSLYHGKMLKIRSAVFSLIHARHSMISAVPSTIEFKKTRTHTEMALLRETVQPHPLIFITK